MRKNIWKILICVCAILAVASLSFAAETRDFDVKASIPQQNGMSVSISKVVGTTWTKDQLSVDFGQLVFDTQYNIFTSTCYYAVDVGISSNAADWTIKHDTIPVINGTGEKLDDNINVSFVRQLTDTTDTPLTKLSYTASNGKTFTKAEVSPNSTEWLRIYYGIATGDGNDAPGTSPIGATKTYGNYSGRVTLTLTP